jgi:hypothetical protein
MDQVHVQLLPYKLIAQHSQQKHLAIIKAAVLTKEQPVLNSQEHAEIIQQQLLVDVIQNHQNVLKEHWLMEFIHVYHLQSHALLKQLTIAIGDNKKMEKHAIIQDQLALHMICQNAQQEQFKICVLEDVFGPTMHVLLQLVLQSLTQLDVQLFTMMMILKSQFVLPQKENVPMPLMPLD